MSHFLVGVIVKDINNADEELKNLMSPYNENISVAPYDEECYCIGEKAEEEIYKTLDEKFGSIESYRKIFWERVNSLSQMKDKEWQFSKEGRKYIDNAWKKEMKPRSDAEELLKESHPDINKANVACEECNGTGKRSSTYNPKSKWDWYVVGGRYDGVIMNNRRQSNDGGFNFSEDHHILGNNIISVKEYLKIAQDHAEDIIPFAIVTPDGEWCEKGRMGWWAIVSDEKDEEKWLYEATRIIKKYPDYYIIGVDCHI
jgi:hypothetical protein